MSQWAAEAVAEKVGRADALFSLGSSKAEAIATAAALWKGDSPTQQDPGDIMAARALLSRLLETTPGLDKFIQAGRQLGKLHAEFSLAERLNVPRLALMSLDKDIQEAHLDFRKSKPDMLPQGFENRSWGFVLELVAQLEELASREVAEDR